MDMTGLKFGKPEPRVLAKAAKVRDDAKQERECRAAVRKRDHGKCVIPGCKEASEHLHHITYRSHSKRRRWLTGNCCSLCAFHHGMLHASKLHITGDADDELIITGDTKKLRFRL